MTRVYLTIAAVAMVTGGTASATSMNAYASKVPPWAIACTSDGLCRASRAVKNTENGQLVATLSVLVARDGSTQGLSVAAPLGVAIKPGIRLVVGEAEIDLPLEVCFPDGCRGTVEFSDQEFRGFLRESRVDVQYFPFAQDTPVRIRVSLEGLEGDLAAAVPERKDLLAP